MSVETDFISVKKCWYTIFSTACSLVILQLGLLSIQLCKHALLVSADVVIRVLSPRDNLSYMPKVINVMHCRKAVVCPGKTHATDT